MQYVWLLCIKLLKNIFLILIFYANLLDLYNNNKIINNRYLYVKRNNACWNNGKQYRKLNKIL